MKLGLAKGILRLGVLLALTLIPVRSSWAQYMFLDIDGDSLSGPGDSLGTSGSYQISVWLVTDKDREGNTVTCSGGNPLTINSYEVILRSVGGGLSWDAYQNALPGMTADLGSKSGGSDFYCGYAGADALDPGKYVLGTLTVTVGSGTPSIDIVPDTPLGGALGTSFGSNCPANDMDNTMKLGIDWFDVDGAHSGSGAGGVTMETLTASGDGHLFLGGNEIPGPWVLSLESGCLTANGYAFPSSARIPTTESAAVLSRDEFFRRIQALTDSLNMSGVPPEIAADQLASYCESNGIGVKVERGKRSVSLLLPDGNRIRLLLGVRELPVPHGGPISDQDMAAGQLRGIATYLKEGCIVFIINRAATAVVPAARKNEALGVISKLRSRTPMGSDEARVVPKLAQAQIISPVLLVRTEGGSR